MKFFLLTFFISSWAWSFPEMIRHHYVNCGACHVSTSGGGVLNAYGRSLSNEMLSTWGTPEEARAFYAIDPEKVGEWLNVGGDVRSLQVHQENDTIKRGRFFWMQGGIDVAVTYQKVTAMMTVGQVQTVNSSWRSIAPKFYLAYQPTDEIAIRAGRYIPIYGINLPQHQFLIKAYLPLSPGLERDSMDVQWNGEKWNFLLGYSKSILNHGFPDETAVNAQAQMTLNDSHKIGVSLWSSDNTSYKRMMNGIHAVLGWSEKFYTLVEVDQVQTTDKATDVQTKSIFQLLKIGYEYYKGVHFQLVQESGKADVDISASETQSLGLGMLWYPRPHLELEGLWSKRKAPGTAGKYEDFAYLLTHYYF